MYRFFLTLFISTISLWTIAQLSSSGGTAAVQAQLSVNTTAAVSPPCSQTIGYFNDFDTSGAYVLPACWSFYNSGLPFSNGVNTANYPPSDVSPSAFLDIFSSGLDTVIAISPRFTDFTSGRKMVSFFAWSEFPGEHLIVGTVDSNTHPYNFHPADTIVLQRDFQEYVIHFDAQNYNGTGNYVAFMHGNQIPYSGIRIDNFLYDTIPDCPNVTNPIVSYISDTSAVINLNDTNSVFDFVWGPRGFNQGSATTVSGNNPFTIHPLTPDTEYEFLVAVNCSAQNNGSSKFSSIRYSFKTLCSPLTAPYYTNFDNHPTGAEALCWRNILRGDGQNFVRVDPVARTAPFSQPNLLYFQNNGNNMPGDLTMTLTPSFSDLDHDDHQLRFVASSTSGNSSLIIGTVTSPQNPETFIQQDSIYLISSNQDRNNPVYQEYIVDLDTSLIPADHRHIALVSSNTSDFYADLFIDNFHYEPRNDCHAPDITSINLIRKDSVSAALNWANGQGTKTTVLYGPKGFKTAGGIYNSIPATTNSILLTSLSSNTEYDIYLVDSCNSGASYWSGPFSLQTACGSLPTPFYENFDGPTWLAGNGYSNEGDIMDNCWSRNPENYFNYTWSVGQGITPSAFTGPDSDVSGSGNYLYTHSSLGNRFDTALVMTPYLNLNYLNDPYLEFYFHRYGTNMTDLHVEYRIDSANWGPLLTITVQPQVASGSPFSKIGVALPDTIGNTQVRFKTISAGFGGGDIAIDEISVDEAPACKMITDINISAISDTSVTLSWAGTGTSQTYELWFGRSGFYQGPFSTGGTKINVASNSLTLDTLRPFTDYQFLVKAKCGVSDSSDYSLVYNFTTLCAAYTAPYFTNYDNDVDGETPYCWDIITKGPTAEVKTLTTNNSYSEPNCLNMNNGSFSNTLVAISPAFSDMPLNDKRIRMQLKRSGNAPEVLYIGTISPPFSDTSFHPLDTIIPTAHYSTYLLELTSTNGYNGSDINVAFMHGNTNAHNPNSREIFIDDFNYEVIPSCLEPANFTVDTSVVSDSTALLTWSSNGSASYTIEYGYAGFALGTGTVQTTTHDSLQVRLAKVNLPYEFYIQSYCNPDSSFYFGPVRFFTPPSLCEDFEAYVKAPFKDQSALFQPVPYSYINDVTEITDARAYTGSQSVHFFPPFSIGISSSIANIENLDTGAYTFSLAINVASGFTGNYSVYQDFLNFGTGFNAFFDSQGTAAFFNNQALITDTLAKFNFIHDTWIHMQHIIDLDNDTTWILVDGNNINAGWKYTQGLPHTTATIDAIGFFASYGFIGGNNDDFYIDDFCIRPFKNCLASVVNSVTAQSCDEVSVNFADTIASVIEYGLAGFTPGNGQILTKSAASVTLSGLQPGTNYEVYTYTICNGNDTSIVSGPYTVTTASAPLPNLQFSSSVTHTPTDQTIMLNGGNSTQTDYIVWNFDGGIVDTGFSSSQTYTTNGPVDIIVTAYNACGQTSDTLTFFINIGLEEVHYGDLHIYPNPVSDELTIQWDEPQTSHIRMRLINAQGQLVKNETWSDVGASFQQSISLKHKPAGMYILILETDKRSWTRQLYKR